MELINALKNKRPRYSKKYDELFKRYVVPVGDNLGAISAEDAALTGKTFRNKYQFYLFAMILGFHRDEKYPVSQGDGIDFWEVKNWQPQKMVDYLLMMILVKEHINLAEVLDHTDEQFSSLVNQITGAIEGYANGGLAFIESELNSTPERFLSPYWYTDLLDEVLNKKAETQSKD